MNADIGVGASAGRTPAAAEVRVYWRPGCPYCRRLRGALNRIGLPTREINIWEDPAAAAIVRSVADGNETVPTVLIGDGYQDTALVNPSAQQVVAAVRDRAPHLLDGPLDGPLDGSPRWWRRQPKQ